MHVLHPHLIKFQTWSRSVQICPRWRCHTFIKLLNFVLKRAASAQSWNKSLYQRLIFSKSKLCQELKSVFALGNLIVQALSLFFLSLYLIYALNTLWDVVYIGVIYNTYIDINMKMVLFLLLGLLSYDSAFTACKKNLKKTFKKMLGLMKILNFIFSITTQENTIVYHRILVIS